MPASGAFVLHDVDLQPETRHQDESCRLLEDEKARELHRSVGCFVDAMSCVHKNYVRLLIAMGVTVTLQYELNHCSLLIHDSLVSRNDLCGLFMSHSIDLDFNF